MSGRIPTAESVRSGEPYERDRTTSDSDLSDVDADIHAPSSGSSAPLRPSGTQERVARLQALSDNRARVRARAAEAEDTADRPSTAASAGPSGSRVGSSQPRFRPLGTATSSSRSTRMPRTGAGGVAGGGVVDLTLSSDEDDDVVFNGLGVANGRGRAALPRQRVTNEEAQRNIQARSQAIARDIREREQRIREGPGIGATGTGRRALVTSDSEDEDSDAPDDVLPEPPRRPVIRPGGAIIRRGGQTINYRFDNLGDGAYGASRTNNARRDEDDYMPDPEDDALPAAPRRNAPRAAPRIQAQAQAQAAFDDNRILGSPPPYVALADIQGRAQFAPEQLIEGRNGFMARVRNMFGAGGGLFGGANMFMAPAIGGGFGAAMVVPMGGPAGRMALDPKAICAAVVPPAYPLIENAPPGTTYDFNTQEMATIQQAADGSMVESVAPDLGCAFCTFKLLASSAYRNDDDKVWVLRCGHLIHQSCLVDLSTPTKQEEDRLLPPSLPVLGGEEEEEEKQAGGSRKRRRTRRGHARRDPNQMDKEEEKHLEWEYKCPIKGCGREHTSYMKGEGGWKQRAGRGAMNVFW